MEKLPPHWFDSQTTARREPKRAKIANGARDRSVCLASVALADDLKTIDGKEYKNVKVIASRPTV